MYGCLCVTEVGSSGAGLLYTVVLPLNVVMLRYVTLRSDVRPLYLYFDNVITSRHTRGAAAEKDVAVEVDTNGEQQLKQMQLGAACGADAIGVQFGLTMQV